MQPEAELGDSDSDAGSDEAKVSKRKKKLESRLKIADLKQVGLDCGTVMYTQLAAHQKLSCCI